MKRAWVLMALALIACKSDQPAGRFANCQLGKAVEVARVAAARFDAIAVVPLGDGALAAWSDVSGTYTRSVDAKGQPRAKALRIGERCRGGLDLEGMGDGVHLVCSRPNANQEESMLALLELDELGAAISQRSLATVGRDGSGVSLARDGDRLLVAYHDGTVGAYAARLIIIEQQVVAEKLLSDLSFAAGPPSIVARNGHWVAAFSETKITTDKTSTRIIVQGDDRATRTLRESELQDPAPTLLWNDASLWIAYRDRSPKNPKPDLYTAHLNGKLEIVGKPQQIGRANSEGAPSVLGCGALRLALLPREYAAERFIGVHGLDGQLRNLDAGHQYYTNSRDFVLASAACVDAAALVLTGERKAPSDPGASLMALPFRCGS